MPSKSLPGSLYGIAGFRGDGPSDWQTGNGRLAWQLWAEKDHWEALEQQDQQGPKVSQHRCRLALLQ